MSSDPAARGPRRSVRIGKYEVLAHVATGGMGAVYRARDTENDRDVALKVLTPEMAANPAMLERFRREARHAAKLRHDNVVTVYEFGEANHTYFLAMEFIDGIDLHEYIQRKGPLDPTEALDIIRQACQALDHAYRQGIVHRDVKPSNFLVARQGDRLVVKMTDLGLARESRGEEFRVTKAGTTVGTLDYMAPEQARDSGLADIRSDLYSLGSTWYYLLAGHAPFPKGGLGERLNRILNEEPQDVRKFNPRVSGSTAAVLRRLMAKRPADRHQTPAALLDDLKSLAKGEPILSPRELLAGLALEEGEAVKPPSRTIKKARRSTSGRRTPRPSSSRSRADTDTDKSTAEEKLIEVEDSSPPYLWYGLAGAVVILVLTASLIVAVVVRRARREEPPAENTPPTNSSQPAPPIIPPSEPPPAPNPEKGQQPSERPPVEGPPKKPTWPALYRPAAAVNLEALHKEIEAPWAAATKPGPTVEFIVGRLPADPAGKTFRSLAAACKAIPAGTTGIIELRDNGPFFDVPAAVADRSLIIRPAKGYRPLLVWDVQRTLDERRRARVRGQPAEEPSPLIFLDVKRGNLALQDIHIALRWPEEPSGGAALLAVEDGDLTVTGCTFSVAAKPRDGLTLARFTAAPSGPGGDKGGRRCRFSRCHVRGAGLSVLDLNAPGAQVLFEHCLLVGGDLPLVQVRAGADQPTVLRAVRSTMIGGKNLLILRPAKATDRDPAFQWIGWDVLLSRKSREGTGELFRLEDSVSVRQMNWRAVNCLYAGWETLLAGASPIPSSDMSAWRRQWGRTDGDVALAEPWPTVVHPEPAEVPTQAYRTADSAVAFAASTADDQLLGCDVDALPVVRDNWLPFTFDRFAVQAPALLDDPSPPDFPAPNGMLYQGERLDLNRVDLGAYLDTVQRTRRLAPRVVLYLTGTGERFTSPIHLKGSSLVLYFEPPAEKAEPLALAAAGQTQREALIEIEQGDLEIIGGTLRLSEAREARVLPWLVKVHGGDVRLFRTRLDVQPKTSGTVFRGLIALDGSGDSSAERVRSCAINESVLVSARGGIHVQGIGARMLLAQTLLIAGQDAMDLALDPGFTGRANVQCLLDHATVAGRGSIVHVPDVKRTGPPIEPVIVQSHHCAFLNPFGARGIRPGLVRYDGEALARGLILWQGDRDVFDRRLWFGAAPAAGPLPDKWEDHATWVALWGTPALRRSVLDLNLLRSFEGERWLPERLLGVRIPAGADLDKIGVKPPPKKAPR